jgi:hypothetical protein
MITLARKLGTTEHVSLLLRKARRLGLATSRDLQTLAVQRGCLHYQRGDEPAGELVSRADFTDEELAIALLCTAAPYDLQSIRCGAAMLSARGNQVDRVARLARMERTVPIVRHVAEAGRRFEPDNAYWSQLLAALPLSPAPRAGVLPHPTRYLAMTGVIRGKPRGIYTQWQRPEPGPFI